MNARSARGGAVLAAALLSLATVCLAAPPPGEYGLIEGRVADTGGIPQMGASVLLVDRYDRIIYKALTGEKGTFRFLSLLPDTYSVRVTLASFLPALRKNVAVQPGMRSFLAINLASVFSSIELVYTAPGQTSIMSDDWKWVLRGSSATRPILRLLPGLDMMNLPARERSGGAFFSDTRGLVKLSAGDRGRASAYGNESDLGTAFAVATSLMGSNQLKFSGNLGYASRSGTPSAGFRTSFSRDIGGTAPEVKLTMRQIFLPSRGAGALFGGQSDAVPALRTMSLTFMDRIELTDVMRLEYGFSLDSVTFLERLNYASPFARLSYSLGDAGTVEVAFHSGMPPAELFLGLTGANADMQQDLAAVAFFPRVSLRKGAVRVQRVQNFELGYRKVVGSRTFSIGAYRESLSNAALTMSAPEGLYETGELMPDLSSKSSIFNVGGYSSIGYTAALTQAFDDRLSATLAYGNGGVLLTRRSELETGDPDELRSLIRSSRRHWLAARLSGQVPWSHTQVAAGYRWTDYHALTPGHAWVTQTAHTDIGFNVHIRQPIPGFPGLPGRWEATADLRNLLAQGYLPLTSADGRRLLLIQVPRSLRGGLSFVF
jgi:hypothetical protein